MQAVTSVVDIDGSPDTCLDGGPCGIGQLSPRIEGVFHYANAFEAWIDSS